MSRDAVHAQLRSAVDVVIHVRRSVEGHRWLSEIAVVTRVSDGLVEAVPAVQFTSAGAPTTGHGVERLEALLDGVGRG
jgi:pilus assembly protein CpaF